MLVLCTVIVLILLATLVVITEDGFRESEKGYNVFPVYKVSGNDTVNTTWYVREKK